MCGVRVLDHLHDLDLALDVVHVLHLALVDKLDGHLTRVRVMGKVRRKGLGWSEGWG